MSNLLIRIGILLIDCEEAYWTTSAEVQMMILPNLERRRQEEPGKAYLLSKVWMWTPWGNVVVGYIGLPQRWKVEVGG